MRRFPSRRYQAHLIALALYVVLALCLTYPLAMKFATQVPGDAIDAPPLTWNLWWVQHSLLQLQNPFDCDYLFYPIKINLAFYTLTVLNGALSIPLQLAFGLIPACNLLLLSSYVLSGWGAYLVIEHMLAGEMKAGDRVPWIHLAAFLGGTVYAFSSSKLFFAALGQFNIASSQWIPFCVLFLLQMRRPGRRVTAAILAGLFLVLQTWAEMTYASFLLIFILVFFIYQIVSNRNARARGAWVLALGVMLLIFAIGLAPILTTMLPDLVAEGNFLLQGSGFAEEYSSDLLGLVVPTQLHPLLGGWVSGLAFPHDKGQHLFLGLATLLLALYGLVAGLRRGIVRFWSVATFLFLLLTFGPAARLNGAPIGVPLPFALLQRLPFFNGNRYPGRLSVMVVLGLGILAAFGLWSLFRRLKNAPNGRTLQVAAIALALVVLEHLSAPLPTVDLTVPEVYRRIAQDPTNGTLLDLPVAWRNGFRVTGTMDPLIMLEQFYQTAHGKRLLAGNTSRNPEYKFQYFTELPIINRLIALETGHRLEPGAIEADRPLAAPLLRFLDVRWIVVHPAATGPDVVPYLEATMPVERIYEGADAIAYRVNLPPEPEPGPQASIDLGEPLAAAHLGEGWGEAYVTDGYVWAQRDGARLMARLDTPPKAMLARIWAPGPRQVLRLDVNGRAVPPVELAEGWGEYKVELPANFLVPGLNRFKLRFSREFPVAGILPQGLPLGTSNLNVPVNLLAKSAGNEIGDFGHLFVNGVNVSPEGVGYNLVALDSVSGDVIGRRTFNTFATEGASVEMAAWVAGLPASSVVVAAVRDEASLRLGAEGMDALRALGLQGDLRGRFRWSHAGIGAPGLAPGQALEDVEEIRPATVKLGLGVTEPDVAAAFDWVRFVGE